ncbi:hypothetical protein OG787_47560 [Streptomyces sp. NBC_00075]|uniref:hypothetical protein n=1 Tax=Streptomyces sp. NBC_00075 TaxID=2975641 RepID=UPI00324AAF9F
MGEQPGVLVVVDAGGLEPMLGGQAVLGLPGGGRPGLTRPPRPGSRRLPCRARHSSARARQPAGAVRVLEGVGEEGQRHRGERDGSEQEQLGERPSQHLVAGRRSWSGPGVRRLGGQSARGRAANGWNTSSGRSRCADVAGSPGGVSARGRSVPAGASVG